jgi:hypothetical protein
MTFYPADLLGLSVREVEWVLLSLVSAPGDLALTTSSGSAAGSDQARSCTLEIKNYSDCSYHSIRYLGLSALVKDGSVDAVFIYNTGSDGFGTFPWPVTVPCPLSEGRELVHRFDISTVTAGELVARWGEPTSKGSGPVGGEGCSAAVCCWDHLGIEVTLRAFDWGEPGALLSQVCLFPPLDVQSCGGCGRGALALKEPLKRCSGCRQVWYCGRECQARHWGRKGRPGHRGACSAPEQRTDIIGF